ncbi:MAG TPA: Rrf2 family transcriptional regulator [Chloroflexota bacterium]|nr:Rrf2 family transcriptional regulator [Chloroflexota bacterium]
MKLSRKTVYGLMALIDMAIQQERDSAGRLTTHDIALRQQIPERFLEQQMTALRNAGLLNSQRGAAGGCSLARRADQITVLDVMEALEGSLFESLADDPDGRGGRATPAAVRELVDRARNRLADLFGSITIADLARRELELRESDAQMFYV